MRTEPVRLAIAALVVCLGAATVAIPASAQAPVGVQGPVKITLDDAIQMALRHNHILLAARTTIQQSEDEEITANLRPNPVLVGDAQFIPIFQPDKLSSAYIDNAAQFDLGISYLFERGKKRQHRLQAAKDQTAVTRSQVADNERTLTFQVATQFINVQLAESALDLAQEDLKSLKQRGYQPGAIQAGDISEDDLWKIKLQLLQFQSDPSQASCERHAFGFAAIARLGISLAITIGRLAGLSTSLRISGIAGQSAGDAP